MNKQLTQLKKKFESHINGRRGEEGNDFDVFYYYNNEKEHLRVNYDMHNDGYILINAITYSNEDLALEDVDLYNSVTETYLHPHKADPKWLSND